MSSRGKLHSEERVKEGRSREWVRCEPLWCGLKGALQLTLAAFLLMAAHPILVPRLPPNLHWISPWASLAPLSAVLGLSLALYTLREAKHPAWLFALTMGGCVFCWLSWIAQSPYLAPFALWAAVALALPIGLTFGLWRFWIGRLNLTSHSSRLLAGLSWCMLEASREHWLSGFPWYPLSIAWLECDISPLAWFGPFGASLPLVAIALELVYGTRLGAGSWSGLCAACSLLASLFPWQSPVELQIALVHSELPVHHFHCGVTSDQILQVLHQRLPKMPPREGALRLLVTPEGLFPNGVRAFQGSNSLIPAQLGPLWQSYALIDLEDDLTQLGKVTNALWVVSPKAELLASYDKRVLVPFAEYFPLADWPWVGSFLKELSRQYGILDALEFGTKEGLVELDEQKIGLSICFEETFCSYALSLRRAGARLWVSVSNDGWYPNSALRWEHALHARLLASSLGLPLLRSTQQGISGVIDAQGGWLKCLEKGQSWLSFVCFDGSLAARWTPFSAMGEWPIRSAWLGLLLQQLARRLRRIVFVR